MNVVIIDYGAGNVKSVEFALNRLGYTAVLSSDPDRIISADKVIFPGVGQASSAMQQLKSKGLDIVIPKLTQPVLGICLGMQLMCASTEEGNVKGLNIFPIHIKKFDTEKVKVPQIGWNTIESNLESKLLEGIDKGSFVYLVHSYYAQLSSYTSAITTYGYEYSTAIERDNFYATQFHPEKSSIIGEQILSNFMKL